eukprot:CAMPEP_0184340034 /NCGR_PEP_ID=MMETSP1089-20130417/8695_1 /TAXON_ID=38269 ORGANISM="Gloeochaete wittrockiana, Strain SAG46.84" /NCGR_SAMPLE_ID=MMETSP1089 /ASSEMBLY_ACC=CAM_ASM_000445 /LENGTH=60 /DNA_ID=CAMNT_0026667613 /DNA_START=247 /DNA_END=429 /DNA_ORIENTATION=-
MSSSRSNISTEWTTAEGKAERGISFRFIVVSTDKVIDPVVLGTRYPTGGGGGGGGGGPLA